MGNLFGVRRRTPTVTAQDKAILQLKHQRDKIRIYQKKTEVDLAKTRDFALELYQNGKKDRALVMLRRKKQMEEILERTDKQLETLEQLVSDIEYTQIEVSVVEGLKVGTEALKQLNSLMDINDIEQIMQDSEEAAEKQREITEILQRSPVRYDESDLLEELKSYIPHPLEDQDREQDVIETKPAIKVDNQTIVVASEEDIAEQLEKLPNVPESVPEKSKEIKSKTRQLELAQ